MIFIKNARLHAELENSSFCYAHQLVNLMIASRKSVISLDECKHQSRLLISGADPGGCHRGYGHGQIFLIN